VVDYIQLARSRNLENRVQEVSEISMGMKNLARELVETVRRNATIDWTVRESARAKLRTMVKRLLRKYGYPPDKQEKATVTVLEQAELLGKDWAG